MSETFQGYCVFNWKVCPLEGVASSSVWPALLVNCPLISSFSLRDETRSFNYCCFIYFFLVFDGIIIKLCMQHHSFLFSSWSLKCKHCEFGGKMKNLFMKYFIVRKRSILKQYYTDNSCSCKSLWFKGKDVSVSLAAVFDWITEQVVFLRLNAGKVLSNIGRTQNTSNI